MKLRNAFAAPALAVVLPLCAGDPGPEAWACREDQGTGALVLNQKIEINNQYLERSIRFRIVGERGKTFVSSFEFDGEAYNIEGRTILPSGQSIPIKTGRDTLLKKVGIDERREVLKVVPPGMTTDCIVELSYRISTRFDVLRQYQGWVNGSFGFNYRGYIGLGCPVERAEIQVTKMLMANWNFNVYDIKPQVNDSGTSRQLVFTKLPAYEQPPFSRRATNLAPSVDIFMNPKELDRAARQGGPQFWQGVAQAWAIPNLLENVHTGNHYRALSESLREGLTGTDIEKAGELMMRLGERIRNLDSLTDQEKQQDYGEKKDSPFEDRDLNGIASRGNSHRHGIFLTYLRVLKDAGIPFKLALGTDGESYMLTPSSMNSTLLDQYMAVVEGPDKQPYYFDPSNRFMTPGVVPPSLQGMQGFLVDPKTRSGEFFTWPVQPATLNRGVFTYRLGLEGDALKVQMEAKFGGFFDQVSRRRYIGKDATEQKRVLKESLVDRQRSTEVQQVEVMNAQSLRKDLTLQVAASQEIEEGRRRVISPFPLMASPVSLPSSWPATRKEFLFAPCAFTWLATSSLEVPQGYRLQTVDPMERENAFGRVVWTTTPDGAGIKVILRIDLNEPMASPKFYPQFREFMTWVGEALERQLVLEKAGA